MNICELNLDCLLRILHFCDDRSLAALCRVHWLFQEIIDTNIYYRRSRDLLMCGHRNKPHISERTLEVLSNALRLTIARNWMQGRYRETKYFHHQQMFPSRVLLERNSFYITYAGYVRIYKRLYSEALNPRYKKEIATATKTDVADFTKKGNTLFAGRVCGSCFIHQDDIVTEQRLHSSKEYMLSVDFVHDKYVTSTDTCCKVWTCSTEFGLLHLDLVHQWAHAFKVAKFNGSGERLFGGLYTDMRLKALREIDMESGAHITHNSNTLSIYDMKLKDENIIFTANFDTTFRLYDRRSMRDECIWEDPFNSSLYCLDYDGLYGILCGAKYYSRVNLYDIRMPGKCMQLFFPYCKKQRSSPVYSIACDSRYLFVATDCNLCVLDFKAGETIARDYRHIIREMRRF